MRVAHACPTSTWGRSKRRLWALGASAVALTLASSSLSSAATLSVVLDTADPLANFTKEGSQPHTAAPGALAILDQSVSDLAYFYANDSAAAPGTTLDLVAAFQVGTSTSNNADSGLRFVINDGQAKAVVVDAVTIGGATGIGMASGVNFSDPANWPVFVPVNWTAPTTLRIRRYANGDAEILEVNGVAPTPRAFLLGSQLPPRNRTFPTVEFGAAGVEALINVTFSEFRSERVPADDENNPSAIQAPINADGTSNFKLGRTIPVQIYVTDAAGNRVGGLAPQLTLAKIGTGGGTVNEPVSSSAADTGTTMRYDATAQQYVFNLSTKASQLSAGEELTEGRYQLTISEPSFSAPVVATFDLRR